MIHAVPVTEEMVALAKTELSESSCTDNVALYAMLHNPDGPLEFTYGCTACHSSMGEFKDPLLVISWYPHTGKHDINNKYRRYLEWLVGEGSPWYPVIDHSINNDIEFMHKHGIVFTKMDVSAPYLVNLCVATRYPFEHGGFTWDKLTKKGVHPSLAFILDTLWRGGTKLDDEGVLAPDGGWHSPMGGHGKNLNADDVLKFIRGEPNKKYLLSPYNRDPKYSPMNTIWGQSIDPLYSKFLKDTYPNQFKSPAPRGVFNQHERRDDSADLTFRNLITIAQAEHTRMGL